MNSNEFAKHCLEEEGYDPFYNDDLDPRAIRNLKYIVNNTSADIVLSSTWRFEPDSFKAVKEQLKAFGLEIIDTTTQDIDVPLSRTEEIQKYLEEHNSIKNYVILDDIEIKGHLKEHWVRCSSKNGLTRILAEKAIEILKGE